MSDVVIRVENLSKHYRLGTIGGATLREDMQRWWANLRGGAESAAAHEGPGGAGTSSHWALRDVSFEVKRGEVLGIIGRNGAGKSTLLKILSRTTSPTSGRAMVKGRVGSLLEVGTGFHPELSGRENIYLNGSILGMSKVEIDRKIDEIIDFSGVERFIETPVKRYSSGMYVRLAFAVAAYLEPEVLIVDEVLAVGDASFQKKCIGKMQAVADNGRTVLLVTHNMGIITSLCSSAIALRDGRIVAVGPTSNAIANYLVGEKVANAGDSGDLSADERRLPGMSSIITKVQLRNDRGVVVSHCEQDDRIVIEIHYAAPKGFENLAGCGFNIRSGAGVRIGGFNTFMALSPPHQIPLYGCVRFTLTNVTFVPGEYFVTPSINSHQGRVVDMVERAVSFVVHPKDLYGTGCLLTPEDGAVAFLCEVAVAPIEPQLIAVC